MASRKKTPDLFGAEDFNVIDELTKIKSKPMQTDPIESAETELGNEEKSQFENAKEPIRSAEEYRDSVASPPIEKRDIYKKAPAAVKKTKVNLYLDAEIKRRTEQAQIDLRRIAEPDKAGQINYSLIVETALEIVFNEFDRKAQASALSQEIINRLK